VFPRYQRIPKHKTARTKWELFALKKGIKKKKRSRMVYSEELKDWVPRWGKGSIKKIKAERDAIRVIKPGEEGIDLFEKAKEEKKLALNKQKMNQFKNELREKGINPRALMEKGEKQRKKTNKKTGRGKKKEILKMQKSQVELANASLGKFDHKTNQEKVVKRIRKRQKVHFKSIKEEMNRDKELMRKMLMK
jgi:regulator of ribosome biosynthesis